MKKLILLAIAFYLISCNERLDEEIITEKTQKTHKKQNDEDSLQSPIVVSKIMDGQDPAIIVPPRR